MHTLQLISYRATRGIQKLFLNARSKLTKDATIGQESTPKAINSIQ